MVPALFEEGAGPGFRGVYSGRITEMFVDVISDVPKATKPKGHNTTPYLSVHSYVGANKYHPAAF